MPRSRLEYPRPQLVRTDWQTLNGIWAFQFDDDDKGLREEWYKPFPFNSQIVVPFAYQTPHSGILDPSFHDIVWYHRGFDVPKAWAGRRVVLHFGAVDYRAWVWVNGQFVTYHEGGSTPFSADITSALRAGVSQSVTVRVEDISRDRSQPRGKQYWEVESAAIWYTRTTGIWQSVWLEPVAETHLARLKITPDVDAASVRIGYALDGDAQDVAIETQISRGGTVIHTRTHDATDQTFAFEGDTLALWSPESPALYDLTVRLTRGGKTIDSAESYFGMRKIAVQDGRVMLNNQPYQMRLVLDQGYHPDSLLTFPSDDAIRADVEITKALGFNGARKHQKVEEPRYLYWADKLGLLVWGEMANAYEFNDRAMRLLSNEWHDVVARDYNHPCVVAWVPINESWGVPDIPNDPRQTDWLLSLYYLTKALDPTRLVISNDGWEHAKSDLFTIHDYTGGEDELRERYASIEKALEWRPGKHALLAPGMSHNDAPLLVTEFGGIAFAVGREGWGYTSAPDEESFLRQLGAVFRPMHDSPLVQGFCYTQLTDVEQEINGLLTYDRKPKAPVDAIRRIVVGESEKENEQAL